MAGLHASTITAAAVQLAGEVRPDITVSHLGTPEQEASLRIGELLIYLRDPGIAARIAQDWDQARTLTTGLPYLAGPSRLRMPVRVGLVGLVVRLGGVPRCAISPVPARAGVATLLMCERRWDR
jgi:hypothetical protein